MPTRRAFNRLAVLSSVGLMVDPGFGFMAAGSEKIKIGQIGTGHSHAEEKFQTVKKLDDIFELAGLVENDPQRRQVVRSMSEFRDAPWISEEQLFNTPGLRAILVETDFNDLLPTAQRCIARGFHVHIDKPPGDSLDGLKRLLETAASHELVVQMGYMYRYHPAFRFCIAAVEEGLIGEIFEVAGVISKKIKEDRRKQIAATYGGGMMLLGCHLIDMVVALCGRPSAVSSYRRQTYPEKDTLFDNELAVFEYPRSIAAVKSTLLEVDGMETRHFNVCGAKGTIRIEPLEPAVLSLTLEEAAGHFNKGRQRVKLPPLSGRYDEQLIDFARQIRGEGEAAFSAAHDLIVHESLLKSCMIIPQEKADR